MCDKKQAVSDTAIYGKLRKQMKAFDYLKDDPEDYIIKYETFIEEQVGYGDMLDKSLFKFFVQMLEDEEAEKWFFDCKKKEKFGRWRTFKKHFIGHFNAKHRETLQFIFQCKQPDKEIVKFFEKKFLFLEKLYPTLPEKDRIKMVLSATSDDLEEKLRYGCEFGVKKFLRLVESHQKEMTPTAPPTAPTATPTVPTVLQRQDAFDLQRTTEDFFKSNAFADIIKNHLNSELGTIVNKAVADAITDAVSNRQ